VQTVVTLSAHSRGSGNPELGPRNGVPSAQARWGAPRGNERVTII